MIKTFTQTDLIRYLYRETSEEEKKEIDKALIRDSDLQALLMELRVMIKELDTASLEPSPATLLNILSYSKDFQKEGKVN
jgi:hypothetical protein